VKQSELLPLQSKPEPHIEVLASELLAANNWNNYFPADLPRVLRGRWMNSYALTAVFQMPWIDKAVRIGALKRARLGPRGGWRYTLGSEEAWEKLLAWRAMLDLGVRSVRDEKLK